MPTTGWWPTARPNEVASLELGLKNVTLERTKDGFFVGANFPADPKLVKEETDFDVNDKSLSENARHVRWLMLMEQNQGQDRCAAGQRFLADHFDTYEKKMDPTSGRYAGISNFRRAAGALAGAVRDRGRGANKSRMPRGRRCR